MNERLDVLLLTTPRPPHLSPQAMNIAENSAPPLGVLCVAAALEKAGFRTIVHDFYIEGGKPRDVVYLLDAFQPRIVGISATTSGADIAYRICRHIKRHSPQTVTIIGGAHATALPCVVTGREEVDFAVRGEGEVTMVELATVLLRDNNKSHIDQIAGICYNVNGQMMLTPDREPIRWQDWPQPARDLIPMDHYLQRGAIITSRGCKYRCLFCSSVTFNTHIYRYRSSQDVITEMDFLRDEFGITSFELLDDTFTCVPERVLELTHLLKSRRHKWSVQATVPDLISQPGLLPAMSGAGCSGVFLGIESGHDPILKKIKRMSRKRILTVVDQAQDAGIQHLVTSFIIGHPWDTTTTIEDTVDLMLQLQDRGAHTPISIMVPFPGSPIATHPERFGITIHSYDYSEYLYSRALISTRHLTCHQLADIYFDILERLVIPTECNHQRGDIGATD